MDEDDYCNIITETVRIQQDDISRRKFEPNSDNCNIVQSISNHLMPQVTCTQEHQTKPGHNDILQVNFAHIYGLELKWNSYVSFT